MQQNHEYHRLAGLEVAVEERIIGFQTTGAGWQSHVYQSLDELPEELQAAFFTDSAEAKPLLLGDLVRQCYRKGLSEAVIHEPYGTGPARSRRTVLRTVSVKLRYKPNG